MTIIDHRVLVSASPENIWQVLGDLSALPSWHIHCTATNILTTQVKGIGARRRNTMQHGPTEVEEILSWYDNLGYEYTIVDGPRYRSNRGRIRLQAIPEGTVVQWTFEYELGGLLAGLRNRMMVRRRLDQTIADSLRQLKKLVEASGGRMDTATIKRVALQPKPSVAERAKLAEQETAMRQAAKAETLINMPPLPPETVIGAEETPSEAPVTTAEENDVVSEEPTTPVDEVLLEPASAEPATATAQLAIDDPLVGGEDTRPHPIEAVVISANSSADAAESLATQLAAEEPPLDEGDTRPGRTADLQDHEKEPAVAATQADTGAAIEDAPAGHDVAAVETATGEMPISSSDEDLTLTDASVPEIGHTQGSDDAPVEELAGGEPDQVAPDIAADEAASGLVDGPSLIVENASSVEAPPDDNKSGSHPADASATAADDSVEQITTLESEGQDVAPSADQSTETAAEAPSDSVSSPEEQQPAPSPSIFDKDIKPIGPSIWEVFGITPPSEDNSATGSDS